MNTEKKVKKFFVPILDVQLAEVNKLCGQGDYKEIIDIKNRIREGKATKRDKEIVAIRYAEVSQYEGVGFQARAGLEKLYHRIIDQLERGATI
jgi:hypothetical protein